MDNRGNIVIYQTKDGKTSIDVKLENETVVADAGAKWQTYSRRIELSSVDI